MLSHTAFLFVFLCCFHRRCGRRSLCGAVVFAPRKNQELAERAGKMAAAVRSQYLLTFTAADPVSDGKVHSIEVRVPFKDLEVFGLPAYRAPGE